MKILGLIKKNSGPCFHRIMMPLLMMECDTKVTNQCTEETLNEGWDAIYYNREISQGVIDVAKAKGIKLVCDVDDYWKLDVHHIGYADSQRVGWEAIQINQIQQADLVTTTHDRLAGLIYPYNHNVVVTPNAIPKHEYFTTQRTESKYPRIFWQGSITHEADLMLLKYPFRRLNGVGTIIAGYTGGDVWDKMVNAFTSGLKHPGMVLPGVAPHEYYANYSHADICVAPLVASMFNSLKSNLKVLEAAHTALPIVCSGVDPYLDFPVLYANKQTDWFKHLNMLVHDAGARDQLGCELHDYCVINYNFDKINKVRYDHIAAR